jgi:hypothetical protein
LALQQWVPRRFNLVLRGQAASLLIFAGGRGHKLRVASFFAVRVGAWRTDFLVLLVLLNQRHLSRLER